MMSPSTCSNPPGSKSSRRWSQSGLGLLGSGNTWRPSSCMSSSLSWRTPCAQLVLRFRHFPVRLSWLATTMWA